MTEQQILEAAYQTLQDNCGIKVGDIVKVWRKAESYEMGWRYFWNSSKNNYIGKMGVVQKILAEGICVDRWYFPFFVLEKIKDAETKPTDKELWKAHKAITGTGPSLQLMHRICEKLEFFK